MSNTKQEEIRDRKGYPVYDGDVLKVDHFETRRKRYFMYKVAATVEGQLVAVCASDLGKKMSVEKAHKYPLRHMNSETYEIVQGHGPGDIVSYEDRPRLRKTKEKK